MRGGVYEEAQHASSLLPARAYSGVGGRAGKGRESEGSFQTPPSNLTFNFLGSMLDGRHFCAA